MSTPGPDGWRLRAALVWLACFVAAALALELVVLAVEIGPVNLATSGAVVVFALIAVWAAIAFWRLVAGRRQRPRLATALLLVAVGWASLGAWTMVWLIVEFNP